jgi:glutamyl-tRNA synthetase
VLGHAPPRYGHVPLWHDNQGQRLSKREGSAGLCGLRAQGLDAPGVIGLLAASAGLVPEGSRLSTNELLQEIDGSPILS